VASVASVAVSSFAAGFPPPHAASRTTAANIVEIGLDM
jgi:hypothetical protein